MAKTHIKDLILGTGDAANPIMDFPNGDGSANQVLTTDGSGNVNWVNPWASMNLSDLQDVTSGIAGKSLLYLNHTTLEWEGLTTAEMASFVQNTTDLQDLSNVDDSPTSGQFLKWDGSSWVTDTVTAATPDLPAVLDESDSYGVTGEVLVKGINGWAAVDKTSIGLGLNDVLSASNISTSAITVGGVTTTGSILSTGGTIAALGTGGNNIFSSSVSAQAGVRIGDTNANTDYYLPTADGTANQIITTDGNGVASWVDNPGAERYFIENYCYNLISSGSTTDTNFLLPGSTTTGIHSESGVVGGSTLSTSAMWNRYKKLSHRFPAGTYDLSMSIDIAVTADASGTAHRSQYAGQDVQYFIKKVSKGASGGDCTITDVTSGNATMHATDTAQSTRTDVTASSVTLTDDDRIMVVIKGTVSGSISWYFHWSYDITATKQ